MSTRAVAAPGNTVLPTHHKHDLAAVVLAVHIGAKVNAAGMMHSTASL